MSSASERANGRANGPVLQSVFLAVIDHSAAEERRQPGGRVERGVRVAEEGEVEVEEEVVEKTTTVKRMKK